MRTYNLQPAADPNRYMRIVASRILKLVTFFGFLAFGVTAGASCNYGADTDWQVRFASEVEVVFVAKVTDIKPPYTVDFSLPRTKDVERVIRTATLEVTEKIKGSLPDTVRVQVAPYLGDPYLSPSETEYLFYSSIGDSYYSAGECSVFHLSRDRKTARRHSARELEVLRKYFKSDGRT